jgi:hypothetical protein
LRRVGMALIVATAGMAVWATTARAASLSVDPVRACYLSGQSANVFGSGYTPSGSVNVTIGGQPGAVAADAAGNITVPLNFLPVKGIVVAAVTATDATNPALTATIQLRITRLHVDVNPVTAPAGKSRRLKGYGLKPGKVYMHVRGPHGYRSDKKIAKAKAPCGTFKTHRTIVPAGVRSGAYKVRFDGKKKYSKKTDPQTGGTLTIKPRFHAVGARAAAFGGAAALERWTSVR